VLIGKSAEMTKKKKKETITQLIFKKIGATTKQFKNKNSSRKDSDDS